MHRYLVERTFNTQVDVSFPRPSDPPGKHEVFAANNTQEGVIWVHSYLSPDCAKSFCVYDAPNPEAIRRASMRNRLPVDRITEVSVLSARFLGPGGYDSAGMVQIG